MLRDHRGLVVKLTHGSGVAIIVSDRAPAEARLPTDLRSWVNRHVRPEFADRDGVVRIAAGWVAQLYERGPNHEWVYGRIPRRILVEEQLARVGGAIPDDWQHLPLSGGPAWAEPGPAKPRCLTEMIELAERLGADTDFVRVDLYDLQGRVVFGELTSFPAGGNGPFDPESLDEEFGRRWTVPRSYR